MYAYSINILIPILDNAQKALNKAFKMNEWMQECLSNPVSRLTDKLEGAVLIKSNIWTQIRETSTLH